MSQKPNAGPGRPKDPAKRQAILEAAKKLFVSKGYEGSSMEAIATEAGVSKLTVYSHFTDKETLFTAAVQSKCTERMPELFSESALQAPLEKLLLTLARGFYQLVNGPDTIALSRLMAAQSGQNPQLAQLFFEAGPQTILGQMERLLDQAQQEGKLQLNCPRRAAEHFLTLIQGCTHFRLIIGCIEQPPEEETEAHIQEVVDLFLRAFKN